MNIIEDSLPDQQRKRKQRYWACQTCGRVYHRKRKDPSRDCCGSPMKKCTTWPRGLMAKHDRIRRRREREFERQKKVLAVIFNSHGKRIKISPKCRKIWKQIEKKYTRHGFLIQANNLVEELFNCIHEGKLNGWSSKPKVEFVELGKGHHGRYSFHLWGSTHVIKINCDDEINEQKETLVHELLHWLDSTARPSYNLEKQLKQSGSCHDKQWDKRLIYLKKKLNFKVKVGIQLIEVGEDGREI